MKRILAGLMVAACALVAGPAPQASAQTYYYITEEDQASPWDKWFALEGHLGLGAPTGILGLTAEVSPARWLALSGGGGIGIDGFQWTAMPRVRFIAHRKGAVQLGAGVSGGKYVHRWLFEDQWENEHALWVNAELSYQFRAFNGFQVRPYLGASVMANTDEIAGSDEPVETGDLGTWLLYTGVALGVAF